MRRLAGAILALALTGCLHHRPARLAEGDPAQGQQWLATMGCGACHIIDGVPGARGNMGPRLAGLASRSMIAGQLPNSPDNLVRWIVNPPAIEPGTAMPNLNVPEQAARDMAAYLYSLR